MAIRLVTGLPGSGKSYYVVNHIVRKHCVSFGDTYDLKDNVVLITNIEGFALGSYNLNDLIAKAGNVKSFFTLEYQKRIVKKFEGKTIIYVIDEAQKYLDRKFYDRGVFGFLESHRHLGLDIWLVSQNANLLARDVLSLAECEFRAAPRTLSLMGFTYIKRSQGHVVGREVLKKSKKIFALYCSQIGEEAEKIKRPYFKYALAFGFAVLAGFILFQFTFATWGSANKEVQAAKSMLAGPVGDTFVVPKRGKKIVPYVLRRVNFVHCNGSIKLYDWSLGQFVPMESFTFPLVADSSSSRLVLYAKVPIIVE